MAGTAETAAQLLREWLPGAREVSARLTDDYRVDIRLRFGGKWHARTLPKTRDPERIVSELQEFVDAVWAAERAGW